MTIDQLNEYAHELRAQLGVMRGDLVVLTKAIRETEAELAEVVAAKAAYWQQVNTEEKA